MKILFILFFMVFFLHNSASIAQVEGIHWQITKAHPACGLSLGYLLPKDQLQEIVGDQLTPQVNSDGKGMLMLFITTADQYNLDSTVCEKLQIAHILVAVEGALNSPRMIAGPNQPINKLFSKYNFYAEPGQIALNVEPKVDSLIAHAEIRTDRGSIRISATFLNKPGDSKTIESAKLSAMENPKSYFIGGESYRPIPIPSAKIESEGSNWITQLNLPAQPDRIWMNVDFVWDFVFVKEE